MDENKNEIEEQNTENQPSTQPDNKKNSEFSKGLFTGLLIGAVGLLVILLAYSMQDANQRVVYVNQNENAESDKDDKTTLGDIEYKMEEIYAYLDYFYLNEIDMDKMKDDICKAMVDSVGDNYTIYYTEQEYEKLEQSTSGSYCGIGIVASQNAENLKMYVSLVYSNSPAAEAGIKAGDEIIAIDGESVEGKKIDTVIPDVRGEEGTKLTLTIRREKKKMDFELTRSHVEIDLVYYTMLKDKIGYVEITQFETPAKEQFANALKDLKEQGMEKLIIDLRNNPGGTMDTVCEIANTFLTKDQLILYTEDKNGKREEQRTEKDGSYIGMELVVLVNEDSASASELFSGLVQDYKLGNVVGTQTFGKGIAQTIRPLSDGKSAIKITYSKYFTPLGRNVQGKGITPDYVVELPEGKTLYDYGMDDDPQILKGLEVLK